MTTAAILAQFAAVTSFMTDDELISASPAAARADERLQAARERHSLCRYLLSYAPPCRAYREDYAEAAAELEAAEAAREKALDRVWARFQRARQAAALTAAA